MSTDRTIKYYCTALDKSAILNRRVVKKNYEVGQDAADVVRDIAANFLNGEGLNTDGVPTSLGTLGSTLVLNLVTVANAFDQIYNLIAAQWWVDSTTSTIYFRPLSEAPTAPIEITETSQNWRDLVVESTLEDYRNKQYVRTNLNILPGSSGSPGEVEAPRRTETYTVPQAFALSAGLLLGAAKLDFSILRIVSIKMTRTGVFTDKDQPVYNAIDAGLNYNLDPVWWYTPDSPYVTPPGNGSGAPSPFPDPPVLADMPQVGDVVTIEYIPSNYTATVQSQSPLSPSPGEGIFTPPGTDLGTCGSGVYEAVDQVTDIQYEDDLNAVAAGILQRSGGVPAKILLSTDHPGVMPGQKIPVYLPRMFLEQSGGPTFLYVIEVSGGQEANNLGSNVQNPGPDASFRWQVVASNRRDYGDYIKFMQRFLKRTDLPLPIVQYEEATFILSPGGSVSSGTNLTNNYIVGRSGRLVECLISTPTPPTDQNLRIDITANGVSIFDGVQAVLPDGETELVRATNFAQDPLYLTKDDILNIGASYQILGVSPTAAGNVTVKLRWAI